jgi:hypothetical protein
MKYPNHIRLPQSTAAAILAFLIAGTAAGSAAIIYENNFNSPTYSTGNLTGQDAWVTFLDGTSTVINGTGINTSQVVGNSSTLTSGNSGGFQPVSLSLTGATTGSFSVDMFRSNAAPTFGAGFGSSANGNQGIAITQNSSNILYRPGVAGGTNVWITDIAGNFFQTANNSWYRITYNLDFTNNQITSAFATNLTAATAATQLYFGANIATQAYTVDEILWDRALFRTALSTSNTIGIDNIQLTAVPEPSIFGLLASVLALAIAASRRRLPLA